MAAYSIANSVALGAQVRTHERQPEEPASRPLKVFTIDPSVRAREGAIAIARVPYEPLTPGPIGALFEVEAADGPVLLAPANLDDPPVLINSGIEPSVQNPAFHQQMVYAVASSVYALFRLALGRVVAWGFDAEESPSDTTRRLKLRPHVAGIGANAGYDKKAGEIRFGYYQSDATVTGRNLPGGLVFTCLSHDIIAHEVTHALIDGLRSRFTIPTGPDVLGFHEGISDMVAVFHHFLYPEALAAQIRKVGPDVERSGLLTAVAANLGLTATAGGALREAFDPKQAIRYHAGLEAHDMGTVLLVAMFEAYMTVFRRKAGRYLHLAPPQREGVWPEDLVKLLADQASSLARQFLVLAIRAVDYCPPVDLELGEYLRALITADYILVPDDPWCYREALIEAFANHGIYPNAVMHLSEDSLLWRPPARPLPVIPTLSFANLHFSGDPSHPASADELIAQATALGDFITQPQWCCEFGLVPPDADVDPPAIQSIRTSRRVGPDGQVLFDLVAEVTQRRRVRDPKTGTGALLFGGATIIVGPLGEIRYVIAKSVMNQQRLDRQFAFQAQSDFWQKTDGQYRLAGDVLGMLHKRKG